MAWLEKRGKRFRLLFRFNNKKHTLNLKAGNSREAESCQARVEENIRLVERGRLTVPEGADLGLFLLSDGRIEKKVEIVRVMRLSELFKLYQTTFTVGAKEKITRRMEDVHLNHILRLIKDRSITEITAGIVQQFVDGRSKETHQGRVIKAKTVRKAVATFRFVMNWAARQGHTTTRFPQVELVFPREKQPEPFRTYDQIATILARSELDKRRKRELWDGLFINPIQLAEVLEVVRVNTTNDWLYPFLCTAAHTGARRSELFRSRIEDFDFDGKLILLRELKRSREKETFRTVDMTPLVEDIVFTYFKSKHPGGVMAFCTEKDESLTDGQAWKAFRTAVGQSKWKVLRGYHAFRHSFASNMAAAGIDQRVIDDLMGHSTEEMRRRYRHLFPDTRRAAVISVFG